MELAKRRSRSAVPALLALGLGIAPVASPGQQARPVDAGTFQEWLSGLSNQGRWGESDERGTLNLIDPSVRIAAAKLVVEGRSVSLAHPLLTTAAADNSEPLEMEMQLRPGAGNPWAVERLSLVYHGYAHTHLDALCHLAREGRLYNGFSAAEITAQGCGKLAIPTAREGVFTRGVLVDLPRLRGVEWLEPGTAIYAEDLEAWEGEAGVRVRPGDALLIRTGRWALRAAQGPADASQSAAGLHASAVSWLRERGVALLGSEAASDVLPSGVEGETHPVHTLALFSLGLPILDNLDLDAAAAEAARLGRWEFLLTLAPLVIPGGTGSPLNPIATF